MNLIILALTVLVISKVFSLLKRNFASATRVMSAATKTTVDQMIESHPVFIASKTYCPYCRATKAFFSDVYPDAYIIELDERSDGAEIQDYLYEKSGQRTVPNVYINKKHIGGNSDVQALGKKKVEKLIGA